MRLMANASATFSLDDKALESAIKTFREAGGDAEKTINDVLETYGTEKVKEEIDRILPVSGRKFKGHTRGAKGSNPFIHKMGNLEFIVTTKSRYGYLYFPDDGTNTRKHAGRKYFMERGAENAAPDIIDRVLARLTEDL